MCTVTLNYFMNAEFSTLIKKLQEKSMNENNDCNGLSANVVSMDDIVFNEPDEALIDNTKLILTDTHLELSMAVPDLNEEELAITFTKPDSLVISGSYVNFFSEEVVEFTHCHKLPENVNVNVTEDNAKVTYTKGILSVKLLVIPEEVIKIVVPKVDETEDEVTTKEE